MENKLFEITYNLGRRMFCTDVLCFMLIYIIRDQVGNLWNKYIK